MADEQLKRRLERLRADFAAETGTAFNHFFCPLLHIDQPTELCKGHIVPKAFGTCDTWVPQRSDIDSFYGSAAEADFIGVVQDQSKTAFEKWLDPKLRKLNRPRLEVQGIRLEHYFSEANKHVPGHTCVEVVGNKGEKICNMVVKMSPEEMRALDEIDLQILVERDYRPAVVASLLKAAHLTLFHVLGYRHVLSPAGRYLAHILKEFFEIHRETPRNNLQKALATYFLPFGCMISPMIINDKSVLRGTVRDNRILACVGSSQGIYAIGVVIAAGNDAFCVFLPTNDGKTIDTYFSFLKDPPPSIAVRLVQFCPADAENKARWETGPGEPFRIPLPHTLPRQDEEVAETR